MGPELPSTLNRRAAAMRSIAGEDGGVTTLHSNQERSAPTGTPLGGNVGLSSDPPSA
jgi:hypothetical protein